MIDETRMIYSIAKQVRVQLESLDKLITNSGFPLRMDWEFKDESRWTELDKKFIDLYLKNY